MIQEVVPYDGIMNLSAAFRKEQIEWFFHCGQWAWEAAIYM